MAKLQRVCNVSSLHSAEWLKVNGFASFRPAMASRNNTRPDSNEAIGARLKLLRRAYSAAQGHTREMNKSDFPRLCGIGVQAWHNAETGINRIGLDNAMRLRARTGAPLDFIYFDNRNWVAERHRHRDRADREAHERPKPAKRASA
jgi:hypothetical protein